MAFETVARTHVGCRRRLNEDALLARPDLGIWAVADGMGGHQAGEVASACVVEALAEPLVGASLAQRAEAAGRRLSAANARLYAMGGEGEGRQTIGSTVVALLAHEGGYACLWAGDSRIYLARDGALTQLTRDHSLVQLLVDSGELDPAAARTHPSSNVVTRAVGAAAGLELDLVVGELRPADTLLLASDGLTRLIDDDELLAAITSPGLEEAADRLVETCLERGAPDNVTLVIVRAR